MMNPQRLEGGAPVSVSASSFGTSDLTSDAQGTCVDSGQTTPVRSTLSSGWCILFGTS